MTPCVFLELTHKGSPIYVRLDSIISVRPDGDLTLVELSTRAVYSVAEPVEVVFERMTEVLADE